MQWVKYEKDPVNGKFYRVEENKFTDEEWEEFCERWKQEEKPRKDEENKGFVFIIFVLLVIQAKFLGIW